MSIRDRIADKLLATLLSRKFWATVIAVALAVVGYVGGDVTLRDALEAVGLALGIYVGAQGIADAGRGRVQP